MNYYSLAKVSDKYDVIIFSSSFMILPYREKALEIAKAHLNKNGRIFFLMTLFKTKGLKQKMLSYLKPYLKYLTTIEFGQITYENDFKEMLNNAGIEITYQGVCNDSIFHKIFKMNVVEAQVMA
eukprot:TRINITY_DN7845_c0_g2_i2.p2 TRINITY_DN7845_c0_g2~~TRINITY_DN7845_c0_g2_i2.p2  ORF type:complete len:124 (-),score=23.37 TRINITY_DN7845_c0_g2_i2:235-606(-)